MQRHRKKRWGERKGEKKNLIWREIDFYVCSVTHDVANPSVSVSCLPEEATAAKVVLKEGLTGGLGTSMKWAWEQAEVTAVLLSISG